MYSIRLKYKVNHKSDSSNCMGGAPLFIFMVVRFHNPISLMNEYQNSSRPPSLKEYGFSLSLHKSPLPEVAGRLVFWKYIFGDSSTVMNVCSPSPVHQPCQASGSVELLDASIAWIIPRERLIGV